MRKLIAMCVCLAIAGSAGVDLLACGDKFLVPSRGTRFEQPPVARQPAAILVYATPTSELSRRLTKLALADALRRVGYQPTVADSAQALAAALNSRRWDIIVADATERKAIEDADQGREKNGVVLVAYSSSGAEWSAVKRQYPGSVKAPGRAGQFVDAIDAALEAQRSTRTARSRL